MGIFFFKCLLFYWRLPRIIANSLRSCDVLNNEWESRSVFFRRLEPRWLSFLPSIISLRRLYLILSSECYLSFLHNRQWLRVIIHTSENVVIRDLLFFKRSPFQFCSKPQHHTTILNRCTTSLSGISVSSSGFRKIIFAL